MATFTIRVFAEVTHYADVEIEADSFQDACNQVIDDNEFGWDAPWDAVDGSPDGIRVDEITRDDGRELGADACWDLDTDEGLDLYLAAAKMADAEGVS